ncbi:MAG: GHKL domain-containing protein [Oscillospiraceae bacterium]|nr:GHKL domain-containing protein [Oscillospiraceae bacterium]
MTASFLVLSIDRILHCCLLATILYIIPLRKRPHFPARISAGLLLGAVFAFYLPKLRVHCSGFIFHLLPIKNPLTVCVVFSLTDVLPVLLFCAGLIYLCCESSPAKAIYTAILAYLTQSLSYTLFVIIFPAYFHHPYEARVLPILWHEILIAAIVHLPVYFIFARKLPLDGIYRFDCIYSIPILAFIIITVRYLNVISTRILQAQGSYLFTFLMISNLMLDFVLLATQIVYRNGAKLRAELEVRNHIQSLQQKEYQLFRNNMDALNHKLHDLRHLVRSLQVSPDAAQSQAALKALEEHIAVLDCSMNTGNETLDALFSEAWLRCGDQKIQWTCMADGAVLNFMSPTDLYILLGNALDNAMEAAAQAEDPQQRFLSVTIQRANQLAYVRIENYCSVIPKFSNGLPLTTKSDKFQHGYGTLSIQSICQKYHGECSMRIEQDIFITELMIPIPPTT